MSKMIRYLFMDVDDTLTDGKIYMGSSGEVFKAFNIKDGYGIKDILIPAGIVPVIVTGRDSEIVTNRCRELGIDQVHQGVQDKVKLIINKTRLFFISFSHCLSPLYKLFKLFYTILIAMIERINVIMLNTETILFSFHPLNSK